MANKKIKLKWAKDDNSNFFNFGDDLVPYLIEELSISDIEYVRYAFSRTRILKIFFVNLVKFNLNITDVKDLVKSFMLKSYVISIGSILQWYSSSRCIVWGSGIISKDSKVKKSTFLAVRGDYTRNKILELGYVAPDVLGDPALLLPLVYSPKVEKKYKLGIIPHITHFDIFNEFNFSEDVLIINLNNENVEEVVKEILSCEKTLSTSLHGLIVSHAYNVKSLWINIKSRPLSGDNVKFYDYFSSVKIPEYSPFLFDFSETFSSMKYIDLIDAHNNANQINTNLFDLQKKLISVAPFPLKSKYQIK